MEPITVLRKPRKCHQCGKMTVVKILYGMPSEVSWELYEKGKLIIGGCCITQDSPEWACTHCATEYKKESNKMLNPSK